jgi:CRP/FNR family transcriptional regulator
MIALDASASPGVAAGADRGVRCNLCCLQELCAPAALAPQEVEYLRRFVRKQERRVSAGEVLYRQGDAFEGLFAVHRGSFKVVLASAEGHERVAGFAFAGDLLGLDAIDRGHHVAMAAALEPSVACVLPWERLEQAAGRVPLVGRQVVRMLSREIRRGEEIGLLLGQLPAEARFAAFLVALSRRFETRGFDGANLQLSMSRPEIGSYLGLTAETVSRLFSRFRAKGLLAASGRNIELRDLARLRAIARQTIPNPPKN